MVSHVFPPYLSFLIQDSKSMSLSSHSSKLLRPRFLTFIICFRFSLSNHAQYWYQHVSNSYMSVQTSQFLNRTFQNTRPIQYQLLFITSGDLAFCKTVNKSRCSWVKYAESPKASSGIIVPFVKISRVNLSKPSLLPYTSRFNLLVNFCNWYK